MEVTILGSGTIVPSLRRGPPGLLLSSDDWTVLCDSGPGIMNRLLRVDVHPVELDSLVYTHFHPDHTAELVPLLFSFNNPELPRERPLSIWGPPGLKKFYRDLRGVYGKCVEPQGYSLSIEEVGEKPFELGPLAVLAGPVSHTPQSVAYRFEGPEGEVVVCSGDTGYCASIIELARGADLLVLECAFPEGHKGDGHLTPSEAGRIGRAAGVKLLALNHFYPSCDESDVLGPLRREFQGNTILTTDLLRLAVHA